MTIDNPELLSGLTLDEMLERWFKHDSRSARPEFLLIGGTGVCGKTRLRHEQYAESHVNVDAGDIFRRLDGDRVLDFPGEHREVIDLFGRMITKTAISCRYNVVTEVHYITDEIFAGVVGRMRLAGYKERVIHLRNEFEEAQRWNLARGPHNVSSYYTDEFHMRWLAEAARECSRVAN